MGRLGEHGAFQDADHTSLLTSDFDDYESLYNIYFCDEEDTTVKTPPAPDCGSHSNTESDRDANNDEISPKPAEPSEGVIGSSDEEPAAGEGLSEEVYEVEKILDRNETNGELFYLVRWKGFGQDDDSWEPVENLSLAVKAINEFEENRKSKKGRKSKTPKSKGKVPRNPEKSQSRSSVTKEQKGSSSSKKKSKSFLDDKTESEPETPSEDDDDEYMEKKEKSAKKSTRGSYSGTVTKAALKSYSPTTTKVSDSTTSARIQTVDTMTAAKKERSAELQALQMRQSWLYDSDSDDDSAPEKENEKKDEEKLEKQKSSANDVDKPKAEEHEKSNDRKRKGEENSAEKKKKKSKVETVSILDKASTEEDVWQKVQNGTASAQSTSEDGPHLDQPEIVALAQDRDGRIRVLIGQDGVKKVVSLRDAHDANSWGLVQHILKFARFTEFGH